MKSIKYNMDYSTYDRLRKEMMPIVVGKETTDIQAGYMLGVQAVLTKLLDGFAVDVR